MKAIAAPALEAVETDDIEFFPKSFKNIYRHWMENIRDWCISRQLWWGHRIPAYYVDNQEVKDIFVAETRAEALAEAQQKYPSVTDADLQQDEDVLDTWFSSWLWPISTLDGFKNSEDFNYFYPTSVLVTGWDIIFLWVARMAMAGFEWKGVRPFKKVYFTGMVRDKLGRKMSKSLGNSPDALKLIDDFGADGVRFGVLSSSPAGGDLKFDEKLCEQGRNFSNKMWNALRLLNGWEISDTKTQPIENQLAIRWLEQKFSQILAEMESDFQQFRLSEALIKQYSFIWDDFCSWYLEMIKPEFGQPIDRLTLDVSADIFKRLMIMLHPFMPFVTEEIFAQLKAIERDKLAKNPNMIDCCVETYPQGLLAVDKLFLRKVETAKEAITKIREIRNSKGIKMRDLLTVKVAATEGGAALLHEAGVTEMIQKLANLEHIELHTEEVKNSVSFIANTEKFYVVLNSAINAAEEREKIQKELDYQRGFLISIDKKLSNERFVSNAKPEVVAAERKKQADAKARIAILTESLAVLN
jgi:valyl-tRNA synthetase